MTRERVYGSDTDFCRWMRYCKELPSLDYESGFGFAASDNDITVHRFMTSIDAIGTREVQGIMQIEIKTQWGKPSQSQLDTLCKLNSFAAVKTQGGVYVRNFGVYILVFDGTNPDTSSKILWVSFPKGKFVKDRGECKQRLITREQLISLLRFELHPDNFTPMPFRRHHKTQEVLEVSTAPLGFEVERLIIKRS